MKKIEFRSFNGGYCAFTDNSVIVANGGLDNVRVYPFGSIAKLSSSFNLKIVAHSGETASFPMRYMHKKSKLKIKELVDEANAKRLSAEKAEPFTEAIDEEKKKRIEKMHKPHKSRKKIIRFWLVTASVVCALLILACLLVGFFKNNSEYTLPGEDVKLSWENLW